ncbi:MAG: hypothetical protein A3F94_02505 [Candidatus Spechtbacteria bacterium RIFCSPLOWO2_12_FULL_38_22]|uniref:M23ase beta-sheet core domain-containing protein n=1 Tax=Candidatus Spechtbacteria bacterium RIFCSPLOWO2_12_FULL_38_22 TaxID=1802165 RepID=A0A1G2HI64_9BACT|nr:MAG: hypothetical protein A2728_01080 [Candidatus Spechtbacteria bacterium RIFCSPHIGHO2_01_FULL_38_11]OGZ59450.1 MAG: hypothetical protein A3E58_00715 [Candidatus Spechtbacteria bacterium RIFCSPHIGHO2_12_FULL_38_30]OGZ61135.1 MAG: hypothetical protein A3A00_01015 [Candidatus Spechtbacteria bacterium RIFCSPLOWO2_01_FULL_38_20]OGZ62079.1 MAG: hypothetical protein A3F94_02505 [Candidatus Spechtbacteria bacterium RIFCSPLOWO2_12_FULL_38_22]
MRKILILCVVVFLITTPYLNRGEVNAQTDQEIEDIQTEIEEQERILQELQKEHESQQKNLQEVQEYAGSLKAQINNFAGQVNLLQGKINIKTQEIYTLQLAVQKLELQIQQQEEEIQNSKVQMASLFQEIYKNDEESVVELLFKYESFSTFYNQVYARKTLNDAISLKLDELKVLKEELGKAQDSIGEEQQVLRQEQQGLRGQKIILDGQKIKQQELLSETKNRESAYQELIISIQEKEQAIEREIFELEEQLRLALDPNSVPRSFPGLFMWPAEGLMTQEYGCLHTKWAKRAYPACDEGKGGFHNGVDVAAALGTHIVAANDGRVVAIGYAPYAYGYWLAIEHTNGLVSVYTHMSSSRPVSIGYNINRGEVVGYMDSTGFSTGSHTHFIVYAPNTFVVKPSKLSGTLPIGATVNPFNYLP